MNKSPNMSLNVLPCGDDVAMVHGAMTVVKLVDGFTNVIDDYQYGENFIFIHFRHNTP